VMSYVNGIMAQKVAPNPKVKSIVEPVVSAKAKSLIRDNWVQMKFNGEIAPKIYLKMFAAHPKTLAMFPQFAKVPLAQLPNELDFLASSHSTFSGLSFIINNMDDPEVIAKLVSKMDSPVFFVPKPSAAVSFDETVRIVMEVMREELGSGFTSEHAAAWTSLMSAINKVLENNLTIRPITSEEKNIMSDNLKMVNKKFGSSMLLKMFITYPNTQILFPNFAKVPVSTLSKNPEFIAFGRMMVNGIEMLVNSIDKPEVIRQVLGNKPYDQYFVADIPLDQQLEETARLIIDSLDEELGARFTTTTRNVWKRAFLLVNSIMLESVK